MKKTDKKRLVAKFINGIATPDEEEIVLNIPEVSNFMKEQWESSVNQVEEEVKPNYYRILAGIYFRIGLADAQKQTIYRVSIMRRLAAAAAVVILLISSAVAVWYFQANSESSTMAISNPRGVNSEIYLPDGSRIWLNPNSKIWFQKSFDQNTRSIELEGEAFFNVSHNPLRPFVVKAGTISVVVKGTRFGINTHNIDGLCNVSLVKGSVSIEGNFKGIKRRLDLKPGEKCSWNGRLGEFGIVNLDSDAWKPWGTTMLKFDNETFGHIARKLEETFGIEVRIPKQLSEKYRFTAVFSDESIYEIFNLLKLTAPFEFSVQGNSVVVFDKTNTNK